MPKIGTYDPATTLTGIEELIGVQGGASVHITPDQFKQLIKNPRYLTTSQTAVAGDFISADTTGGAITITLPATPSANQLVSVYDFGGNAATENITIGRNGETIDGLAEDFIIDENYGRVDLIYDGADWKISIVTPGAGLTEAQVDVRIDLKTIGLQSDYIKVEDMYNPTASSPPASTVIIGDSDGAGNSSFHARAFDDTIQEHLKLAWKVPNNFDTTYGISFRTYWSPATTSVGSVQWELRAGGLSDGAQLGQNTPGASMQIIDAGQGNAEYLQISDLPVNGPKFADEINPNDLLYAYFIRRPDGGLGDDFVGDAYLIGIDIIYRTTAATED